MKLAIRVQIGAILLLVSYYLALFWGYEIPTNNVKEIQTGKDLLLLLVNIQGLALIVKRADDQIDKGDTP